MLQISLCQQVASVFFNCDLLKKCVTGSPLKCYNHVYSRFQMSNKSAIFAYIYILTEIIHKSVNFTHLKLWFAVARHNFKWVKISTFNFITSLQGSKVNMPRCAVRVRERRQMKKTPLCLQRSAKLPDKSGYVFRDQSASGA